MRADVRRIDGQEQRQQLLDQAVIDAASLGAGVDADTTTAGEPHAHAAAAAIAVAERLFARRAPQQLPDDTSIARERA